MNNQNEKVNAEALTNEELEQTAGGATVYTENGFYVTQDNPVPVNPVPVNPVPVNPVPVNPVPVVPVTSGTSTYVVQKGDTLSKIAKTYGTTVSNLMALNPQITDANKISIGQVIRVR